MEHLRGGCATGFSKMRYKSLIATLMEADGKIFDIDDVKAAYRMWFVSVMH